MKSILLIVGLTTVLAGCVVAPYNQPVVRVIPAPQVQISYIWDPVSVRYYYVDNNRRHYMPRDWRHDNGQHRGWDKKDKRDKYDRRDRRD